MRGLWLFPGQGGQRAGMLANVSPKLKKQVENWTDLKLVDTDEGYRNSQQIQVGILLKQVDEVDRLTKLGHKPTLVAGHSLGVFGAAYAAGVITKEDIFKLVSLRAQLMEKSYPHGYGMGVVVGMTRNELGKLVKQVHSQANPVYLSNQNSELQNTLSGKLTAVDQVLALAEKNGARKAKRLRVPNPSHSPLMAKAADQLTKALAKLKLAPPKCIYLANNNGHAVKSLDEVKYDLGNNLIHPVFWETMLSVALEYQPDYSCEFAPGTAFTKLLKAKNDSLPTITLANMSVDDADFLLKKWQKGIENG